LIYLLLLLQQLIASGTHIVAKTLTAEIPAPVALFYRALLVSTLYSIVLLFKRDIFKKVEPKDWLRFILIGLLNIPINQFLFLSSLELTEAPNVAFAYSLVPAFVLIISVSFFKEKTTKLKLLGIAIAVTGTVLLLLNKGFDINNLSTKGDILALIASLSWAFYTILGKQLAEKYGAIFTTGIAMIFGLILYLPVFHFHPVEYSLSDISAKNWWQIFYIGAITSGVGYTLWYYALQKIEASKVSVFNNIQPVLTTILAYFILDNAINANFVVAGVLIIAGVVITQRG
jgi:drug/metabolite transporter (DMT)-like permease